MSNKQLGLTTGSVVKRVQGIDFQFELFAKAKLASTCAERSEFVLNDEAIRKIENGEDVSLSDLKNYKLTTREKVINIFGSGDGYRSIEGVSRYSYAKKMAGLDEMTSDETKLMLSGQMIGSIEANETEPFVKEF